MFFLFFCVLCGDHVTFDISLYGYEFITFKFTINLYYILGMMKKSSKRATITTGSLKEGIPPLLSVMDELRSVSCTYDVSS
jgi:hypothetical protein